MSSAALMLVGLPGQTISLAEWQVFAAYAVFAVSYLVFALGKLPGMKIDRPGMAIIGAVLIASTLPLAAAKVPTQPLTPANVLSVMERVADWQLGHPSVHAATDWTQAAGDAGMMALAGISSDTKYRDAMLAMGKANGWAPGPRMYHADELAIGQTYVGLYFYYRDPKMIAPLRARLDAILAAPPAIQSLDFQQPYDQVSQLWSWCDALFMAPPVWMQMYAATGDKRYLDYAVKNWWRTTDYLYDPAEHLYFRDSTYFEKREANGKKVFWSRGNGWVMAGLVRVLQLLPENDPNRARFEQLFRDMAGAVLKAQQPDGLWRASLLDPESYPLKETSGSGFYTYALAWGVNRGLLDAATFKPAIRKAWNALVDCVQPDGKLTHVQPIGSDPKKFADDSTEVYGVGAFLLAGSEVYRMAESKPPSGPGQRPADCLGGGW
jgi:rhamnogalacturonyl hydrolase YesR